MATKKYSYKQLYNADLQRHIGGGYTRKLLKYFRKCQTTGGLLLYYYRWRFKKLKDKK